MTMPNIADRGSGARVRRRERGTGRGRRAQLFRDLSGVARRPCHVVTTSVGEARPPSALTGLSSRQSPESLGPRSSDATCHRAWSARRRPPADGPSPEDLRPSARNCLILAMTSTSRSWTTSTLSWAMSPKRGLPSTYPPWAFFSRRLFAIRCRIKPRSSCADPRIWRMAVRIGSSGSSSRSSSPSPKLNTCPPGARNLGEYPVLLGHLASQAVQRREHDAVDSLDPEALGALRRDPVGCRRRLLR